MKKIFLLGILLSLALTIFGVQSVLSTFQTVPVTIAQSSPIQTTSIDGPKGQVVLPAYSAVTPAATHTVPAPNLFPTLAPIVTEPAVPLGPVDNVVAAASIIQEPTSTADQLLLEQFVASVSGKDAGTVTGVLVPGRFALPVLQQPVGNSSFVSTEDNTVTQFGAPGVYGTIGLLAHNYLSGQKYFDLREGDDVVIIYGDGVQTSYRITQIERYQALTPTSVYSDFIDLSDPGQTKLSASEVFTRMYTEKNRVVFQTCIEDNGDPSWGRIFVVAEKINP